LRGKESAQAAALNVEIFTAAFSETLAASSHGPRVRAGRVSWRKGVARRIRILRGGPGAKNGLLQRAAV